MAPWYVEDQHTPIRVQQCLDIHSEADPVQKLRMQVDEVVVRRRSDDASRDFVRYPKHEPTAALVRNSDAVSAQLLLVELVLRCLELELLPF